MGDDQSLRRETDQADTPGAGDWRSVQDAHEPQATYGRVAAGPWHADGQSTASSLAERIVATTSAALIVLDEELRIRSANPAFYALFDVNQADTEGHSFFAVGGGQWDVPWLREPLGQLLSMDGHLEDIELQFDTPFIGNRTMLLSAQRLVGDSAPDLILLEIEDVTTRRAIEQERQAFVLLLAHEVRSPLTSIMGYVQLMQRRPGHDEAALAVVMAQARQINRLVDELLESSTRGSGQLHLEPRLMDLAALARVSAQQAQLLHPNHSLRLELPNGPLCGHWDGGRLAQVFANLISNAIKYSPAGGEIVVWVDDLGNVVRVSVQDHGIGISPDQLPHLFDQFYRVVSTAGQANGLGLGLHLVKMLVEAHGGSLGVESVLGLGSTFYFTLPLAAPADAEA